MTATVSRRRVLATALALAAGSAVSAAHAEPRRPFRIYMALWRGWEEAAQGFRDYFVHRQIPVDLIVRDAAQDRSRLKDFVVEARALKVDLVFTWGTTVTEEMLGRIDDPDPSARITDIPAVFAIVSQPLGGVVPSLDSSGRNITGTLYLVPMETQVNLIRSYRPFRRLGIVYTPVERNSQVVVRDLAALARAQGFDLTAVPVDVVEGRPRADSIAAKVAEIAAAGADFLYIPPDTFLNVNRDRLTGAALERGIPTFAAAENPVVASKAMFGGVYRYYTVGQLTAAKAEQILIHRVRPSDIPIDAPRRLSILINMPVVRQLGLYPPMALLELAEILDGADFPLSREMP